MKNFLKYTFASCLGALIAGGIVTILGIGIIMSVVMPSDIETVIKRNSIYRLDLSGNVTERRSENPLGEFFGNTDLFIGLEDIIKSIEKARKEENIKGIYLHAGAFVCSSASLQEIRRALIDFKESGKFIIAYGDAYTQSSYYLASVADKVILNPSGMISWHGMSAQLMFYKEALEKLGVEMQVFRVGTYKAAVEPYISTEMSEANEEQTLAYLQSIWNQIVSDVSISRNLSVEMLNRLADKNMDFAEASEYVAVGMVDTLMYKDQLLDYLKEKVGMPQDNKHSILSMTEVLNIRDENAVPNKNKIALYYAYGAIDDAMALSSDGINSTQMVIDLRKLRENDDIKAVVLRVNSPGGSAFGSEQIWREVALLKKKKPVIVSMGDYAASGGYYISCEADWIVAEPTTLTGSIGIFGMIPDASKLMTETIGLHFDGVKTNRLADMGTMGRPLNNEEKTLFQKSINNGYELFIRRCAEGRDMTTDEIKKVAEGRVWTGIMAKELGLIDQLGGIDDAIAAAARHALLDEYEVCSYPEKEDIITVLLSGEVPERYINAQINETFGEFSRGVHFLRNIKHIDRIQARMPYEIIVE